MKKKILNEYVKERRNKIIEYLKKVEYATREELAKNITFQKNELNTDLYNLKINKIIGKGFFIDNVGKTYYYLKEKK